MPKKKSSNEQAERLEEVVKDNRTDEILANSEATLDCIKELTKTVAELVAEWKKWSAAGKF